MAAKPEGGSRLNCDAVPRRAAGSARARFAGAIAASAATAAIGVCLIGLVAALSGLSRSQSAQAPATAPLSPVSVMRVANAPGYDVTRRFNGQVEAPARAALGFELSGRLYEVLVEEGDRVSRGALLARLDVSALLPERAALEAELAALTADAELARLTMTRNDALSERGFRSVAARDDARLALTRAQARIKAVQAQIAGVDVRLAKSRLVAPFDGWIGARLLDPGKTVAAGEPALVLFDAGPPRLRVGLPEELAAAMAQGEEVTVAAKGGKVRGTILQIRRDLDPATRSRSIVIALPANTKDALGDAAALVMTQFIPERGFWAPLSALREGARGAWTVLTLERGSDGDRIAPAAVEALHADGQRVFVRSALPDGARVVTGAAHRVAPGQFVAALPE